MTKVGKGIFCLPSVKTRRQLTLISAIENYHYFYGMKLLKTTTLLAIISLYYSFLNEWNEVTVSREEIKEHKNIVIDLDKFKCDSVKIIFPKGGTVSSVALFKDSIMDWKTVYKGVSFGISDTLNYIYVSKKDTGTYYASFGSCHWGSDFKITVK